MLTLLLGCVLGSLFEPDAQLPIVALGLFFKLQVLSTIVHPDNIDLVPILFPLLELFARWLDHASLLLIEIHKLQLCSFINNNPTMLIIYSLDIFRLLDGTYVKVNSSLATSSLEMLIAFCFALSTMHAAHTPRVPLFNSKQHAFHSCAQAIHEPF
jgi:hypothetical protein